MNAPEPFLLLTAAEHAAQGGDANGEVLALANDADVIEQATAIAKASRVELHFPSFTDGRAYSQAYLLRRRLGFRGDLRATGEVLADQLMLMQRTGFSSAVLAEGVAPEDARRQLARFPAFYQGDARQDAPYRREGEDGAAADATAPSASRKPGGPSRQSRFNPARPSPGRKRESAAPAGPPCRIRR